MGGSHFIGFMYVFTKMAQTGRYNERHIILSRVKILPVVVKVPDFISRVKVQKIMFKYYSNKS